MPIVSAHFPRLAPPRPAPSLKIPQACYPNANQAATWVTPVTWRLRALGVALLAVGALALVSLGGCASPPLPDAQLAVSQAALDRATGPAATDAPLELAAARDKLGRARLAYAAKDVPLAHRLAREAEADAVLAETLGRSARAERALVEVRQGIRQLQDEMRTAPSRAAPKP